MTAPLIIVPTSPLEAALLKNTERLQKTCYRLTGTATDAEDLFQETWVRTLTRPPDLSRELGPWLDRVAKNLFIDRYRRARRMVLSPEPLAIEPEAVHPALIRQQASRAWVVALSTLSPLQRAVFLLREVLENDTTETAALLGLSEGSVRTNLHRARQAMSNSAEGPTSLSRSVLSELSSARVCSVGDVAMLGRRTKTWRRLWMGPADGAIWQVLLELLIFCSDSIGNRAHLKYLEGTLASRQDRQQEAQEHLILALAWAEEAGDQRLVWVIRHEQAVVGLRAFEPRVVDEALTALSQAPDRSPLHRTWVMSARASLAFRTGNAAEAAQIGRRMLAGARTAFLRRKLQINVAVYENQEGDLQRALQRINAAIAALDEEADLEALTNAYNTQGMILQNLAALEPAEAAFHRAIDIEEQAFGGRAGYRPMGNLALLRIEQGRLEEAWALLCEAQERNQQQNQRSTAINLANRAMVALMAGRIPLAVTLLGESISLAEQIEDLRFLAHVSAMRAAALGLQGSDPAPDLATARQHSQDNQSVVLQSLQAVATARTAPEAARQTLATLSSPRLRCTERLAIQLLTLVLDADDAEE